MAASKDGPVSPLFKPLSFRGNASLGSLRKAGASKEMAAATEYAPSGSCVSWGMPFKVGSVAVVKERPVTVKLRPSKARWLVFMHASDQRPFETDGRGFASPTRGRGQLGEHAADYVIIYSDGTESRAKIRRRHHLGAFTRGWGENCFEAVAHRKPRPVRAQHEQGIRGWGSSQTRVAGDDGGRWVNWLWAWKNPKPGKKIAAVRFEPVSGTVVVSAVTAGNVKELPTRWNPRRKALFRLPRGVKFKAELDDGGQLSQIKLDMGVVISARPRPVYPDRTWSRGYNNKVPEISDREVLIEYAAHPEARFHLARGRTVPVAKLSGRGHAAPLEPVRRASQRVTIRVVERRSRKPVAVKLHVHGEHGEYLAPVDRHRIPNHAWFEDYSVDFAHQGRHFCTYIDGEAALDLPLGRVYVEVSKGFEIRPVRKVVRVTRGTKKITVEIEKVLRWRESNWVSADTHVHFLSTQSAMLEGSGEGVNIVNLLASQWGELMTNVGDFDGKTTHGSKEAGGDGEYLVRVGTENRQHIMGHISLIGYEGPIIAPMTTGGPDESALGDPVEILLTEWARQCRKQNGVVVIPHFPNPRLENAATIVSGGADGVEMTAWGDHYSGINPYSLSDWYRYLNCGYFVAAVGGTDKMSAVTAVGTVRTYAQIARGKEFTYKQWKRAVRDGRTFVTYGPLVEFAVEGKPAGSRIRMKKTGGTVDVTWKAASVTVPMTRVELVVNGEIVEGRRVKSGGDEGTFSVKLDRSSWIALLVRGRQKDKPEMIAAHTSPVMVEVKGTAFFAAADALTILEQIEGALAFLDTVGTRAEAASYKRMRMVLTSAHREVHNRMHRSGVYHGHSPSEDHAEHHRKKKRRKS